MSDETSEQANVNLALIQSNMFALEALFVLVKHIPNQEDRDAALEALSGMSKSMSYVLNILRQPK